MIRRLNRPAAWLACTVGVLTVAGSASAASELRQLVPGVTYERIEAPGQVNHVVRVVQGPLIDIRPVLTAGAPSRRGALTDAMRARLGDGALVGINGDYFNFGDDHPSGLLIQEGELVSEPEATRPALVFGTDGRLVSEQFAMVGTWQATDPAGVLTFPERGFVGVNRSIRPDRTGEIIVYTPRYGNVTPGGSRVDVLVALDPPGTTVPNQPLTGTVQSRQSGGGVGIGPGKLVISGIGTSADTVLADLEVGRRVTINFGLAGLPVGTLAAIGGGPTLVQGGAPQSGFGGFTSAQIGTRTSRTAIGQAADGTVLLVASEGPFQGSRGVSMDEQAELLARLGAHTAIGMDGGGSSMLALHDRLLTPWASERAISNAVVVKYGGVQLTQPAALISPNGDGVADATSTTARAPKNGQARIVLVNSAGRAVRVLFDGSLGPSGRRLQLGRDVGRVADGRYRVVARFTPSDGTAGTNHRQDFVVDRSIGHIRLQKVGKTPDTRLRIGFRVGRATRVTVVVKDAKGGSVKLIFRNRRLVPGQYALLWDMKRRGKPLKEGIYTVSVRSSSIGKPALAARFRAPKPPAPKPSPEG